MLSQLNYCACVIIPQLVFNVIGEMVGSWWLALIFQTSHVISEVCNVLALTSVHADQPVVC